MSPKLMKYFRMRKLRNYMISTERRVYKVGEEEECPSRIYFSEEAEIRHKSNIEK